VNSLFSQAGSQYDLSNLDIGQLKDRACELEKQQWGMKKKLNLRVMNIIDTVCAQLVLCLARNLLAHFFGV
jgi:hypothetical protein